MKKILLIIFLFSSIIVYGQINEMVLPTGDTVYIMNKNTRDLIFENMRELKQRRDDTISYTKELSIANERIKILRDSIILALMPKKDSLYNTIINKQKKEGLVKIEGLFAEGEVGYLAKNNEYLISLGTMLNIKLWNFTLAPGFKIFKIQPDWQLGAFIRVGIKIY